MQPRESLVPKNNEPQNQEGVFRSIAKRLSVTVEKVRAVFASQPKKRITQTTRLQLEQFENRAMMDGFGVLNDADAITMIRNADSLDHYNDTYVVGQMDPSAGNSKYVVELVPKESGWKGTLQDTVKIENGNITQVKAGEWAGNAVTTEKLKGDAYASFTIASADFQLLGLADPNEVHEGNNQEPEFGFIMLPNKRFKIWEYDKPVFEVGTYEIGDQLHVTRQGSTVSYFYNGKLVYISKQQFANDLEARVSIYAQGTSVSKVEVGTFAKRELTKPAEVQQPTQLSIQSNQEAPVASLSQNAETIVNANWQSTLQDNATMKDGAITMVKGGEWAGNMATAEKFNGSVYASFTVSSQKHQLLGLADPSLVHEGNNQAPESGFYLGQDGTLKIWEYNSPAHVAGKYQIGDVLRVERQGNQITYSKNGQLLYTSQKTFDTALEGRVSLFEKDTTVSNVTIGIPVNTQSAALAQASAAPSALPLHELRIDDPQIKANLETVLFEQSGMNLSHQDMMVLFYQKYPQYQPTQFNAYIDQIWKTQYPGFYRGQVDETQRHVMMDLINTFDDARMRYNEHLSHSAIPAAMAVIEERAHGRPDAEKLTQLNTAMQGFKGIRISQLSQLGYTMPSSVALLEKAQGLYRSAGTFLTYFKNEDAQARDRGLIEYLRTEEAKRFDAVNASAWLDRGAIVNQPVSSAVADHNQKMWGYYMEELRANQRTGVQTPSFTAWNNAAVDAAFAGYGEANAPTLATDASVGGVEIAYTIESARADVSNLSGAQQFMVTQNWLNPNGSTVPNNLHVRNDSIVGTLFNGLVQKLSKADAKGQLFLAAMVESVTDIPAHKVLDTIRPNTGLSIAALNDLFIQAGYENIFVNQSDASTNPRVLTADIDRPTYTNQENIRIRFDVVTSGKTINYVEVFRAGDETNSLNTVRSKTFIEVPLEKIGMSGNAQLKLVVYFKDGTTAEKLTDTFQVQWDGQGPDVVTTTKLSDDPIENAILQRMMSPVVSEVGNKWEVELGSPFHADIPKDVYAADINWGSENQDMGKPVFSSYKGVVVAAPDDGNKFGIVEIKHTVSTNVDGKLKDFVWFTRYMHMQNISVKIGDNVAAHQQIGEVGDVRDVSKIKTMTPHLHFAIYAISSDNTVHALDLSNWLQLNNIQTRPLK